MALFSPSKKQEWAKALLLVLALTACGSRGRHVRSAPPPPPPEPAVQTAEPIDPGGPAPHIPAGPARVTIPAKTAPPAPPREPEPVRVIPAAPEDPATLIRAYVHQSPGGQKLPYRLFEPWNFEPDKDYPLVIFLHGSSARGVDNRRHLNGSSEPGISLWTSNKVQREHPSYVLAPQSRTEWVNSWALVERPPNRKEPLELVLELVESLKQRHNIDPRRIYITGVSMGGFGVWGAITRHPTYFAGAVAVCGGGSPRLVQPNPTPVWAFHGANDRVVSPRRSREMIAAVRTVGGEPRYTEYKNVRHDSWKWAFSEPELVPWLFARRLW